MTTATKTLEALGFVDENGELHLDEPLDLSSTRVRVSIVVESGRAANNGRMTSVRQVCDFFVKKAKHLDVVQEILLVGENEACTEIWTVTSTSNMDFEARYPIYDIQAEVARATDRPIVGFHSLTIENLRADGATDILPRGAKSLWKREYAASN